MMIWVEKKNFKNFHRPFLAISKKLFFCLFKICEPVIMYNSPNFQSILDFSRPQLISTDLFKVYFSKFFCQSSHYWWPKITQPPKTSEIPKNCVLKILKKFDTTPGLVLWLFVWSFSLAFTFLWILEQKYEKFTNI